MERATQRLRRVRVGGVPIDRLTFGEAIDAIEALIDARRGGAIFTPNVDHIVQFSENERLRRAYEAADLSVADGMPVVWASRLLGEPVPERVAGSDLVLPLARRGAERGWRILFLGGAEGIGEMAKRRLEDAIPGVQIVGTMSPRIDMAGPREERAHVVDAVRAVEPDLVFVALGAPKQELWIDEVRAALAPAVFIGAGASLDFIAGTLKRAPPWLAKAGLEWAYRLSREPKRLWRRYLLRDPKFAALILRDLRRVRKERI